MRRKDKEIIDKSAINAIIKKSRVCRLAMFDGSCPYIVPLCFGYQGNTLYFHSAHKGQKIDILRENPKVCFEFDAVYDTLGSDAPCSWSMKYESVIGFGCVTLVEAVAEKQKALGIIMSQYSDRQFQFPENKVNATTVFKVDIERLSAKQSGF